MENLRDNYFNAQMRDINGSRTLNNKSNEDKANNTIPVSNFNILNFTFEEKIMAIWEKSNRQTHAKVSDIIIQKPINNVKTEEKKPEFTYSPFDNFF